MSGCEGGYKNRDPHREPQMQSPPRGETSTRQLGHRRAAKQIQFTVNTYRYRPVGRPLGHETNPILCSEVQDKLKGRRVPRNKPISLSRCSDTLGRLTGIDKTNPTVCSAVQRSATVRRRSPANYAQSTRKEKSPRSFTSIRLDPLQSRRGRPSTRSTPIAPDLGSPGAIFRFAECFERPPRHGVAQSLT